MSSALGVITIVVIILLLILIIPAALFRIKPFIREHTNLKINFCIIFGYLALLVLLSLVCLILPGGALVKSEKSPQISDSSKAYALFDKKSADGDFSAPEGFTKTEKSFAPQGDTVNVMTVNYNAAIITKTKGVDAPDNHDGKIDVYCYTVKNARVDGTNLPDKTQIRAITYSDNEIKIASNVQQPVGLYQFADCYTASQFIRLVNINTNIYPSQISNTVIVIFPKGVEVNGTGTSN